VRVYTCIVMDDATSLIKSLPDDVNELKRLIADHQSTIAEHQSTITKLTQQRDEYYVEKLRLEMRLAKALKQAYGPRADRVKDLGQLLLGFGEDLQALPIQIEDLPSEPDEAATQPAPSRRLRTRGRRDIGKLDHLPLIEQVYELTDELCRCPNCQAERNKIGSAVSYTVEYIPGSLVRIKHVQHKYACRHCEQNGHNPNITLATKTNGSPIDKGMPGPGLLAYVATAKFGDYMPLYRLENFFAREGFELDRSTMCVWMADVARLVRPLYDRMVQRVRQSHVLATDDTVMPMQHPGKTKKARMWIYQGDESQPYNVFAFTLSRNRDGPAEFLKDFENTLLADAYGGYDRC
jgi:transposase